MEQKAKRKAQMSRNSAIHCQADGYRYLAGKVLEQSKRDLLGDDPVDSLDAFVWWVFGDGPDWAECLGFYKSPSEILLWILGGCGDDEGSEIN